MGRQYLGHYRIFLIPLGLPPGVVLRPWQPFLPSQIESQSIRETTTVRRQESSPGSIYSHDLNPISAAAEIYDYSSLGILTGDGRRQVSVTSA